MHLPPTYPLHLTPAPVARSFNWSGYAAVAKRGVQFRSVVAYFTVASLDCGHSPPGSSGFAMVSQWAGLDGFTRSSSTVEQAGVVSSCNSFGETNYNLFYELFPLDPVTFEGVNPGDAIRVRIFFTGSLYKLIVDDLTNGDSISALQPCPSGSTCRSSSAEVIIEDPGHSTPETNLADFGMVNVTGASVATRSGRHGTLAASALWTSSKIFMINKATPFLVLAQPSPLYGGQAFNVLWRNPS
jgi:hypothetical protein